MFVATKYICKTRLSRDKSLVATIILLSGQKTCFGRDKHELVWTKVSLSRQTFVDKYLSRQKWYFWQLPPMIEMCGLYSYDIWQRRFSLLLSRSAFNAKGASGRLEIGSIRSYAPAKLIHCRLGRICGGSPLTSRVLFPMRSKQPRG